MALQTDPIVRKTASWCGHALPPESPLDMPTQSLARGPRAPRMPQGWRVYLARLVVFGGAALLTGYGAFQMSAVFGNESQTPLQMLLLALFTVTFGWIALSACQALAALFALGAARPAEAKGPLTCRTALLMPVYNEDPGSTCAALQAMGEGLAERGDGEAFEIFLLSDTTDPETWGQETACFAQLRRSLSDRMNVWYRHRTGNTGRKAGNLRDFVERWGGRYDYMLVLDADSLMAPATVSRLTRRMQAVPDLGILQTLPVLAGSGTLFARIQQFAGRLYGPIIGRGVASWQGVDGNYWGHNAIIRTRAFAQCCGLPDLPGRKPFGGHVLSHDFVEAALMRRGGWKVRMDADLGGSWEGAPQTILDLAARDRRWAQGNLQHAKVVGARGLSWCNRAHFLIGIGSYLMSPLWLAMLFTGALLTAQSLLQQREYFGDRPQLFPDWPIFDAERMMWLLALAMTLLFLPKLMGVLRALAVADLRRAFGGPGAILGGAAVEIVLSALIAPLLMFYQVRQVVEILSGRDSGWSAQSRGAQAMPWGKAVRLHGLQAVIGAAASGAVLMSVPEQFVWVAPVLAGLTFAPVLSWLTCRATGGALSRLLHTPEDRLPPPVADRAAALRRGYAEAAAVTPGQLLSEPATAQPHLATLAPPPVNAPRIGLERPSPNNGSLDVEALTARAKIDAARHADESVALMSRAEMRSVLGNPELIRHAHAKFAPTPPRDVLKRPA